MNLRVILLGMVLMTTTSLSSLAQPRNHTDVLFLKNGWILHGEVVKTDSSYVLTTPQGQVFSFAPAEVDRHGFQGPTPEAKDSKPWTFTYPEAGLTGTMQLSLLSGGQDLGGGITAVTTPELSLSMGYRWNHWLSTNLGTGLTFFEQGHLLPVFAEVRGDVWPTKGTLFYFGRLGYGFMPFQNATWVDGFGNERELDARGGAMYEIGAGVKVFTLAQYAIGLSISYRGQNATFANGGWGGNLIRDEVSFQRIGIQLGLAF